MGKTIYLSIALFYTNAQPKLSEVFTPYLCICCTYQRVQSLHTFSPPVIILLGSMWCCTNTLRKPFPQTIRGVTRDWHPKVTNEQDSHQGCLLTHSQAPQLGINQNLLLSQTVSYHSLVYTDWHKLQGITLFGMPFLLCTFPSQSLPSPGGSDWATRFTLSAQNAHQHLRQLCINTAMVILLFQLKLPSSLS